MSAELVSKLEVLTVREHEILFENISKSTSTQYIKGGKFMLLMRGVPGSGKTTLVNELMEKLNTTNVCSADHYFYRNGVYRFDPDKLRNAHEYCHQKAEKFCAESQKVVIIDNTNIKRWETTFYINLAEKFGYTVFEIVPEGHYTVPAQVLAARNKHGVDQTIIRGRQRDFETLMPRYYGWFLGKMECEELHSLREKATRLCKEHSILDDRQVYNPLQSQLHVTSIYIGGRGDKDSYPHLNNHIGCVDKMRIQGITVTPHTISAIVLLNRKALPFYHNDTELPDSDSANAGFQKGYAAHITLACAPHTRPVKAREDTITSRRYLLSGIPADRPHEDIKHFKGKNLTVVRAEKEITAIFAAAF